MNCKSDLLTKSMGMYRSGSLQTIINHYSAGKKPKLQRRDSVKLRNLGLKDKMKVIIIIMIMKKMIIIIIIIIIIIMIIIIITLIHIVIAVPVDQIPLKVHADDASLPRSL